MTMKARSDKRDHEARFQMISERVFLSPEQERGLFERARAGDANGRERIVECHLPLAEALALKSYRKISSLGYTELADLKAAAYEGLLIAVDRHDVSTGCRFSTYATHWIQNRLRLHIRRARWWAPNIPDHVYRNLIEVLQLKRLCPANAGLHEIQAMVQAQGSARLQKFVGAKARRQDLSLRKLAGLLSWASSDTISLNSPVGDGDDELGDLLESTTIQSPHYFIDRQRLQEYTEMVLRTLTPKEERLITQRFNIGGEREESTLELIAKSLRVTPERVRQIECSALRKLRHPSRSRKLRAFNEELR